MTEQEAADLLIGYLHAGHGTALECSCEPEWNCFEGRYVARRKRHLFVFGERMKIDAECLVMLAAVVKAAIESGVKA